MKTHTLQIQGMGSDHCILVVSNIVKGLDGTRLDSIEVGRATITLDENKISTQSLKAAIEKEGYIVIN